MSTCMVKVMNGFYVLTLSLGRIGSSQHYQITKPPSNMEASLCFSSMTFGEQMEHKTHQHRILEMAGIGQAGIPISLLSSLI